MDGEEIIFRRYRIRYFSIRFPLDIEELQFFLDVSRGGDKFGYSKVEIGFNQSIDERYLREGNYR